MYFIIEREHKLGYPCFYAIMLCFVDEKLQKLQSGWGSAPDPDRGAYSAPPYPLAGREGATPPPAPTPALNQFHLIAFPNPSVSRPAYGPASDAWMSFIQIYMYRCNVMHACPRRFRINAIKWMNVAQYCFIQIITTLLVGLMF